MCPLSHRTPPANTYCLVCYLFNKYPLPSIWNCLLVYCVVIVSRANSSSHSASAIQPVCAPYKSYARTYVQPPLSLPLRSSKLFLYTRVLAHANSATVIRQGLLYFHAATTYSLCAILLRFLLDFATLLNEHYSASLLTRLMLFLLYDYCS